MTAKKLLILTVSLLLISGLALAGQTIIQKGSIVTDVFNATGLFVERVSGHRVSGQVFMGGNRITGSGEPVNPQDCATKGYVDEAVRECSAVPPEARGAVFQTVGGGLDALADPEGNVYVVSKKQVCDYNYYGTCIRYKQVCYLTKMKPNLQGIWEKEVSGCGDYPSRLLFDNQGRVIIAGTSASTGFGGASYYSSAYRVDSNGENGERLSIKVAGQYALGMGAPSSVAVDSEGYIYSVYYASPSTRWGWEEDPYYRFYLAKYDPDGEEVLWKKGIHNISAGWAMAGGTAALIAPDGSVIAIAASSATSTAPYSLSTSISAEIKKFDSDGSLLKSGSVSLGEGAFLSDAEVDSQGNIFISAVGGYKHGSVVKVDGESLKRLWRKEKQVYVQMAADGSGGVYVADSNGGTGNWGYRIILYDSDGGIVWSRGGGEGLPLDVELQPEAVVVLVQGVTSCQGVIAIPCYSRAYYTLERRLP